MKRVLIFYSHFSPAFKAGGPVQSLVNLVNTLRYRYQFYVVCSAFEMGDTLPLAGIIPDTWNAYAENVNVYYIAKSPAGAIKEAIMYCQPDVVYVNGMYVPHYSVLPIWFARKEKIRVIVAPRGMLQKGALAVKPFKKKIFMSLFKLFGLHKNVMWHATDEQERIDILDLFGNDAAVKLASNIPKAPYTAPVKRVKETGQLKLVYLSLITEKKNLHLVLLALQRVSTPVTFDIYGPVKDQVYWEKCQALIAGQKHQIQYHGVVSPQDVQKKFSEYHALILPTKGENFGHAIYEAFSVGTPAIISQFTPWGELQLSQAGFTVALDEQATWSNTITALAACDQSQFDRMSQGAHNLSLTYYSKNDFKSAYLNLFG